MARRGKVFVTEKSNRIVSGWDRSVILIDERRSYNIYHHSQWCFAVRQALHHQQGSLHGNFYIVQMFLDTCFAEKDKGKREHCKQPTSHSNFGVLSPERFGSHS
jgi:hypothetical protein